MHMRVQICAAIVVASVFATGARAQVADSFYEVETKYIFGFTEGSGIGLEGEKEFSAETVAGFGRRDGHYAASQTKLEFEHTPNQFLQIEFGALVATQDIRNVTGFDDRNAVGFGGLFGEIRYLMVERGASSPFAITVSVEPVWRRLDETTGERVTNYELESKLNIDTQLIENRLYFGLNLIYEPETTRIATGEWEKESTFGVSGALTFRPLPKLLVGGELGYFRHYDGIGFNTYTGDALFLGPTLYLQLTNKAFVTAAWATQIAGQAVGDPNPLNLADFSRNKAKLKFAFEF
jgi:hypothetical protein